MARAHSWENRLVFHFSLKSYETYDCKISYTVLLGYMYIADPCQISCFLKIGCKCDTLPLLKCDCRLSKRLLDVSPPEIGGDKKTENEDQSHFLLYYTTNDACTLAVPSMYSRLLFLLQQVQIELFFMLRGLRCYQRKYSLGSTVISSKVSEYE